MRRSRTHEQASVLVATNKGLVAGHPFRIEKNGPGDFCRGRSV